MTTKTLEECSLRILRGVTHKDFVKGKFFRPDLYSFRQCQVADQSLLQWEISVYQELDSRALELLLSDRIAAANGVTFISRERMFEAIHSIDRGRQLFFFAHDPILASPGVVENPYHSNVVAKIDAREVDLSNVASMLATLTKVYMAESDLEIAYRA